MEPNATAADIKRASRRAHRPPPDPSHAALSLPQAYRVLAKTHHPDKGGDPALFSRLQAAYETLSDPRKRQARWAGASACFTCLTACFPLQVRKVAAYLFVPSS